VTALDFNNIGTCVVSGSADGTICIISVPETSPSSGINIWSYLLLLVVMVFILIAVIPLDDAEL
jgi:WD40 repeat protein